MEPQKKRPAVERVHPEKMEPDEILHPDFYERNGIPLELIKNVPVSYEGSKEQSDMHLAYPGIYRPNWISTRDIEFNAFLLRLLNDSKYFSDIRAQAVVGKNNRFRVDFIANIKTKEESEQILIECKNFSELSSAHLNQTMNQINKYREVSGIQRAAVAFPGRVTKKSRDMLRNARIDVWDIDFMATNFADELRTVKHPYFQPLLRSYLTVFPTSREERLLTELRSCQPGKEDWNIYRKLIGQILVHLFHPPLESPIAGFTGFARTNYHDFIIPNYATEGFWNFMRHKYGADYIVADVKNYKAKVKRKDAIHLANYLKSHGSGLFGIIVSRTGQDTDCLQALKEEWVAHSKLIIVLSDEDIEEMLLAKSSGGLAEATIGSIIKNFRISL